MKIKILSVVLCVILLFSVLVVPSFALTPEQYGYRYKYTVSLLGEDSLSTDYSYMLSLSYPCFVSVYINDYSYSYDCPENGTVVIRKTMGGYQYSVLLYNQENSVVSGVSLSGSTTSTTGFPINLSDRTGGGYSKVATLNTLSLYSFDIYTDTLIPDGTFDTQYWNVTVTDNQAPASSPIDQLTSAWSSIMSWIITSLASVQLVFYNEGLTFLGVLAVVGVAIAVAFLIIGVVQKFLRLRG